MSEVLKSKFAKFQWMASLAVFIWWFAEGPHDLHVPVGKDVRAVILTGGISPWEVSFAMP